ASGRGYSPGQHEGRLQAAGRSFPEGNPVAPPLHATSSPSPHRRSGPSPQAAHSDRQSSSVSVDPSRPKSAWEKRGKVYHSPGEAFGKDDGRRLPTHEPVSADPDSSWHYKGCSHRHRVQNIRPSATV